MEGESEGGRERGREREREKLLIYINIIKLKCN